MANVTWVESSHKIQTPPIKSSHVRLQNHKKAINVAWQLSHFPEQSNTIPKK